MSPFFGKNKPFYSTMTFANEKKMYLTKQDKSKKGDIDSLVLPLLNIINRKEEYYTTSSCSGRVYLWQGSGKKNETNWITVSHEPIREDFFKVSEPAGIVWLRLEAFILQVACRDLDSANKLLEESRKIYKKSCILSASNKIIVEIRGSEFLEMPLYNNNELLFCGSRSWLVGYINAKMRGIAEGIRRFEKVVEKV